MKWCQYWIDRCEPCRMPVRVIWTRENQRRFPCELFCMIILYTNKIESYWEWLKLGLHWGWWIHVDGRKTGWRDSFNGRKWGDWGKPLPHFFENIGRVFIARLNLPHWNDHPTRQTMMASWAGARTHWDPRPVRPRRTKVRRRRYADGTQGIPSASHVCVWNIETPRRVKYCVGWRVWFFF